MEKLAIIGTGIAGMSCAHFLQNKFDITIFEQNNYVGGHTNTCYVPEDEKHIPIDTGFIVCNNENYPNLMKLFQELDVPLQKTKMSFAAQIIHDKLEYCGSSLAMLFAQKKNLFSPRYYRFLLQLNRFNTQCLEVLENEKLQGLSILEYCEVKNFHQDLLNWYLLPMSSALWSTAPQTTVHFPVLSLVRFFKNHGFLGLNTQFQWYTVKGGSEEYKKKLISPFKNRILLQNKVVELDKNESKWHIRTSNNDTYLFDKIIIATHADQALKLLKTPSQEQRVFLSAFKYEKNTATLHTDASMMPQQKKIWSSWNYRIHNSEQKLNSSCTYWMNSLQQVSVKENYFVTINDYGFINQKKIIKTFEYEHPIFTVDAMQMQKHLDALNTNGQLFFCGSYFRYGFHEDAIQSSVKVCESLLQKSVWT